MTDRKTRLPVIAMLLVLSLSLAFSQEQVAKLADDNETNRYSSPLSVFESARDASLRRDWKRYLDYLTPDALKVALFDMLNACVDSDSKDGERILLTYLDNPERFWQDVDRNIERMQNPTDETPGGKQRQIQSRPATTLQVGDALVAHVSDKAGFYGAASDLISRDARECRFGPLEEVTVNGDTAVGRAKSIKWVTEQQPSQPRKRIEQESYRTIMFRRIDQKWLIDAPQ